MKVISVGGIAPCSSRPGAISRGLVVVIVTIATGVALLLPTPAAHARVIVGTAGDDHIVGTPRADQVRGRAGDDDVIARGGRDDVDGGRGNDIIRLGPGKDTGDGGGRDGFAAGGADTISGGPGDDLILDGDRRDQVHGNTGNDRMRLGGGEDTARGGYSDDFFRVRPDGVADRIVCGPGTDTVLFVEGRDPEDQTIGCERTRLG